MTVKGLRSITVPHTRHYMCSMVVDDSVTPKSLWPFSSAPDFFFSFAAAAAATGQLEPLNLFFHCMCVMFCRLLLAAFLKWFGVSSDLACHLASVY